MFFLVWLIFVLNEIILLILLVLRDIKYIFILPLTGNFDYFKSCIFFIFFWLHFYSVWTNITELCTCTSKIFFMWVYSLGVRAECLMKILKMSIVIYPETEWHHVLVNFPARFWIQCKIGNKRRFLCLMSLIIRAS